MKRSRIKAQGRSRFPKRRDTKYCVWIRGQRCLLADRTHCDLWFTRIEADHIQTRGAGGYDQANLIPLCRKHHQMRHDQGVKTFAQRYGVDLKQSAKDYWRIYQDELA